MEKVVIVGAGPCGLLLAHYLLRRGDRYQVEIYERLGDPRELTLSNSRSIHYSLHERGFRALRPIDGLEAAIKAECVEHWMDVFYKANGKTDLFRREQPIFSTNRISVVKTLLSSLVKMASPSRLKLHFNCQCIGVDFDRQTILFESVSPDAKSELETFVVPYDRLVGADGARSIVRSQFLKTQSFDCEQTTFRSCYKTFFIPSKNEETGGDLHPKGLHFRPGTGAGIDFIIAAPQVNGGYIGHVFAFTNQQEILNFESAASVKDFFRQHFPEVSLLLSDAEAEAFMKRPISTQLKIRCSRYHHGDRVLLIGDAAHAVSATTGQDCNAAFRDAQIFDRVLDECEDRWELALPQFTEQRLPDAHALWELDGNVFPVSKILFAEFILREGWGKVGHRWFPNWVAPPIPDSLLGTLPYTEILKMYRGWIAKVKASNLKLSLL